MTAEPTVDSSGQSPLTLLSWPYRRGVMNPYTERMGRAVAERGMDVAEFSPWRLLAGRADVWHMHWPEGAVRSRNPAVAALRLGAFALLVLAARARGVACVWTVHNLQGHDRTHPRLEEWLWRFLVPRLDGVVLLSQATEAPLWRRHPASRRLPSRVVPHGHFRGVYPNTIGRDAARARYGFGPRDRVAAFVGRIRPYKNVDQLIAAVRGLDDPALRLVVAGHADDPALGGRLRALAGDDPRIRLDLGFLPDDAMQVPLNAADLVVLPYQDILNSGAAILALSFGRPVLVPGLGAMGELRAMAGHPWVQCFDGPLTAGALERALAAVPAQGDPDLTPLDWSESGRRLADFYASLCRRGAGR